MTRLSEVVNSDLAACRLHANFSKLFAIGPNESDRDSIPTEEKEMERDKSRFTVKLIVLLNAFLFSTCFFMDNSVFPVSIVGKCFCYCLCKHSKRRFNRSKMLRDTLLLREEVVL